MGVELAMGMKPLGGHESNCLEGHPRYEKVSAVWGRSCTFAEARIGEMLVSSNFTVHLKKKTGMCETGGVARS